MKNSKKTMTIKEVAEKLNVSEKFVNSLLKEKKLKILKNGTFSTSMVEKYYKKFKKAQEDALIELSNMEQLKNFPF